MNTIKFLVSKSPIFFVCFFLIIFTGCEEEIANNNTLCTNFAFNINKFEENLVDELDGQVMGYSYVIAKDGVLQASGSGGLGRSAADGSKNMSVNNRMQVASISKNITTVATLSVLEDKGVDVNTSIADYLPPDWTLGNGIENLTFYDLLWQGSNLNQVGTQGFNATRFDSLRTYIAAGASGPKNRFYTNTHHGMLRVILPRLWDVPRPNDGQYDDDFTSSVYKQCVQEVIFDKIGINNADCIPPDNNPNLAYSGPNDNGNGSGGTSNFTGVAGGIGWNLSAMDIAKFFAFSMFTNDFISDESIDMMKDDEMGFWNSTNGDKGRYICKLGGWNYGSSRQFRSCMMQYPNNIQVTIITNSGAANGKGLTSVARDAFDDAYACQ